MFGTLKTITKHKTRAAASRWYDNDDIPWHQNYAELPQAGASVHSNFPCIGGGRSYVGRRGARFTCAWAAACAHAGPRTPGDGSPTPYGPYFDKGDGYDVNSGDKLIGYIR